MRYAHIIFPILACSIISFSVYSFNNPTLQEQAERESQRKLDSCTKEISEKATFSEKQDQIKKCGEIKPIILLNVEESTATGSDNSVPLGKVNIKSVKSVENHSDDVSLDLSKSKQKKANTGSVGLDNLHKKVCEKQINSPLCKDRALFNRLYQITEERLPGKNFYPILLGITNAESSLGLNFAKDNIGGTCAERNNWGGVKWEITDTGERIKDQKIPDQYGCYLYKFASIEHYWISKVNTVRFGYKGCVDHKTPIRCMSYAYVGNRYVAEESWIRNVSIFLN